MFHSFKRILCAFMVILTLCAALPASAEVTYFNTPVYIISNILNAYQKPDASSKVLGVMTYGEVMLMQAFSGSWVRIKNGKGEIGYCALTGLSTENPNDLSEVVYAKENNTPVYHKASASYKVLCRVKQNAMLNVVAMTPDQQWLRVKNGSQYGYVQSSQVSRQPVSQHGAITSHSAVYVISENGYTVTSGLGKGKSMGHISHGQAYQFIATNGRYAAIRNSKGKIGYCPASLLSTKDPNNMNATMYAQVGGNMLYANSVIKGNGRYLAQNSRVTVVAKTPEGGWYRVLYGGKYYYVRSILLDVEPAPDGGREVCALQSYGLYAKPHYSSRKIGRVYSGDSLNLLGMNKYGAKVRTSDGTVGYFPITMLEASEWTFAIRRS